MDIRMSGLDLLHEPDEIIEIRSIDPKPVISGYFRADSPAIAQEIARYPNRTFYQTMNRLKNACYAREQHERLMERPHETTSNSDINGYQWILVDADPVRPSGVSASKEEKEAARRVAGMVMKKLMAMGFSEPIVADSGNGYHLLFKIHAGVDDRQVIADFLSVLDMWFSTESVKIDTAVFNPARITKLYGTLARKGARRKGLTGRAASFASRNSFRKHPWIWSETSPPNVSARFQCLIIPAPEAARRLIWISSWRITAFRSFRKSRSAVV